MKKRVFSMLMVLVMLAGMLSVPALAADEAAEQVEQIAEAEQVVETEEAVVIEEAQAEETEVAAEAEEAVQEEAQEEAVQEEAQEEAAQEEAAQEEASQPEVQDVADHKHYDFSGDYVCDVAGCEQTLTAKELTSLTISGLVEPVDGAMADFGVSIAESDFGNANVKWKRMTKVNGSDAKNMANTNTYAAGNMYNVEIWVPYNYNDPISPTINITLNGKTVPFYTTVTAYNNAAATFEGIGNVYRAHFSWENGARCIVVSVLYGKLGGNHYCQYGWDWISTGTQHYHMCTGCGATKDVTGHTDTNKDGLCDACNFKIGTGSAGGTTGGHTHAYGNDWVEDNANHWKQCTGCGAKTQTAAHYDGNKTGKCDVCGFVMTAAAGHTHTYGTDWTETFAQHYKECSCGAKTEIAAHYDGNKSGLCDVCGYTMTSTSTGGGTVVPATGDSEAAFLWAGALIVSVMGLAATVMIARKRRED